MKNRYIILNFSFVGTKLLERELDDVVFKDLAFGSKIMYLISGDSYSIDYSHVLVPLNEGFELPNNEFTTILRNSIEPSIELKPSEIESIISVLDISDMFKKNLFRFKVHIVPLAIISEDDISIGYSDGSFRKNQTVAGYACYKLLNEDSNGVLDNFTGNNYSYQEYSGVVKNGTNNIGELTGIKTLIDNFSDKRYQLIISDSQYGLKSYREWIYNWQKNGFLTYSKKPISNQDLIESTYNALQNSGKVVFFKWTRGHNDDAFNEMCDKLANKAVDEYNGVN